jgi:hypothetical protein
MGDTTMTNDLPDTAEAMEAQATHETVPLGWTLLNVGLTLWGAWYLWAYSPWGSGWTQAGQLEGAQAAGAPVETNVTLTILFTALPTAAVLGLWLVQRARKKA